MTAPVIVLDEVLSKNARVLGDKPAVTWHDRRLTYREVDACTRRVALGLRSRGLAPGDRVSILGRNSVDIALHTIAVLRSGLTIAPLNWRHSPAELEDTVAQIEPSALLYAEENAEVASGLEAGSKGLRHAFCIDATGQGSVDELVEGVDGAAAVPAPDGEDLAAIISTGGTEGPSKGVMVTYANMAASAVNVLSVEGPKREDVYMVLPQMFHNPHLYLFPYLLVGATLVVPHMKAFDASLLLSTIERERITRFLGVATMVNYLLASPDMGRRDLGSLELIAYGGAPFAPATLERAAAAFTCGFLQLYGQTETSVLITTLSAAEHRRALADERSVHLLESCGREVPLTEALVVDEDGRQVPPDRETIGEIIARGPSVMRGYWMQESLTAETLRDGWCHTGDLAVRDEHGYLYIVDRKKDMIVSGGENVYPRVVEDVIYQHPAVREAAVVGVPDETWGEAVKAVVVLLPGQRLTEDELVEFCRQRLASYMKPRSVDFVEELPKNPSGKVLKREVRDAYWGGSGRRVGGV